VIGCLDLDEPKDAKIEGKGALVGLGVAAVVVAGAIAIVLHLSSASKSEVSGSLTIDEGTFQPTVCRSGKIEEDGPHDRPRFYGVDLLGGGGRSVRVLEDPTEGQSVVVIDSGQAPRPVDRSQCARFDVQLRETGELIMEVWGIGGSIDLDCPDVSGQVRFESCYSGR
jgi:hypothetical protein